MPAWCFAVACWTAACWFGLSATLQAEDFPQFRGLTADGHSRETDLPLTWSDTEHVKWSVPVAGAGWSSPSIAGGKVWLTTALEDGKSLRVLSFDAATGTALVNRECFAKADPGPIHKKNSHASPTPLVLGERVFVHFGAHGTACLAHDGEIVWTKTLDYNHRHGPAASPVLFENLLIVPCDGGDQQFVVALDQATGEERWRTTREGRMAYCTPFLAETAHGTQLISPGGEWVHAYDPKTGMEIWKVRYPGGYSVVPRPVFGHGMTFVSSGYDTPVFYGLKVDEDAAGDVTDSHIVWTLKKNAPLNPSPLLVGDELYLMSDNGVASCLKATSGEVVWQKRVGGNYSASPLLAEGRIYLLDEDGKCTVIKAGTVYEELAVNQVTGRTLASLAASDRALFLRTDSKLMRIQK